MIGKTFPLRVTEDWLEKVEKAANILGISKHEYILKAVQHSLEEGKNETV